MKRRSVLVAAGAVLAPGGGTLKAQEGRKWRVGVIGHTGRGNFGHGLDTVWLKVPETEIAGVADADGEGLAKAVERLRLGANQGYADYRAMLAEVRPEVVAVCPRHVDQHRDMILAAVEAGARGIYVEKPYCRTPAEADEIRAACEKTGAKVAVAHRNRYHPALGVMDELIREGKIGRLLEIRGRGKGDRRGGAEDLWVLGSHVLNLMAYFGGEARSCSALVRKAGRWVTAEDMGEGAEGLGPLAGDEVRARYEMGEGVLGYFDSVANDGTGGEGFGLQLVGSEGIFQIQCDRNPVAHWVPGNPYRPGVEAGPWIPVTAAGLGKEETAGQREEVVRVHDHRAAVADLLAACEEDRDALCGLREGAQTVEMIRAVFASHGQGGQAVKIPLEERG